MPDLTIDPPPDLAIEVDIWGRSIGAEPIYAALDVEATKHRSSFGSGSEMQFQQMIDGRHGSLQDWKPVSYDAPIAPTTGDVPRLTKGKTSGATIYVPVGAGRNARNAA